MASDVTASTTTVGDPSVDFAESVITLGSPLTYMSYHVFQGVYADGKTATGSLRAWSHPFLHASWNVFPCPDNDTACAAGVDPERRQSRTQRGAEPVRWRGG